MSRYPVLEASTKPLFDDGVCLPGFPTYAAYVEFNEALWAVSGIGKWLRSLDPDPRNQKGLNPRDGQFTLLLPPDLRAQLLAAVRASGESTAAWVRTAIREKIERDSK